jgi:hypothetical protein
MGAVAKAATSIPCEFCGKEIRAADTACPGCARPVTAQDRALLQVKVEGTDHLAFERGRRVRKAAGWIGILAILLTIGAGVEFIGAKTQADDTLAKLALMTDDEELAPIDGQTYTVPGLRAELEREPFLVLGLGLLLASIMGGLWLWARRSPLPAITCAIAIFLIVQVLGALVDPKTIFNGILMKAFALVALGKGLSAALATRAAAAAGKAQPGA